MATLTNQKIKDTYDGLIKTSDNGGITGTFKQLTDGLGTNIPIEVSETDLRILSNSIQITDTAQTNGFSISNASMLFGGTVDFSSATITGLAAGGLVAGTGTNSMKSAASLTATAAVASSTGTIALGDGASAISFQGIAIGQGAETKDGIALGKDADTAGFAAGTAIAIGNAAAANSYRGIAIGNNTSCNAEDGVALGQGANAARSGDVAIGDGANTTGSGSGNTIALGVSALVPSAVNARALALQTNSTPTAGGIIMSDAGGTDRRLNITASGGLQVDGNAVGGGAQFELPAFTVPANATSDICYAVVTIPANTFAAGDILELRSLEKRDSLNNTVYESYWFSEQSQTVGTAVQAGTSYQQAGIQSADNGSTYYQKTLWIDATNTTVFPYGTANETSAGVVQGGDPVESQPVDWTVTQYFYYQGYSDATVGTVENFGTLLRKIN